MSVLIAVLLLLGINWFATEVLNLWPLAVFKLLGTGGWLLVGLAVLGFGAWCIGGDSARADLSVRSDREL